MSESLKGCRVIKGWIKPFLSDISGGFTELNAAQRAGVSTIMVEQEVNQDPAFKKSYQDAYDNRTELPGHGAW